MSQQASPATPGSDVVVGIDVGKSFLDLHVGPDIEEFRVPNDSNGIREAVRRVAAHRPRLVALESTGGYEQDAVHIFLAAGIAVAMVNPRRISDFRKSMDRHAKTDRSDAFVIAEFARSQRNLRPQVKRDRNAVELLELCRRRRQLVRQRTSESTRAERIASKSAQQSVARVVRFLDREILAVEDAIRKTLQEDDDGGAANADLRRRVQIVDSVPGIALVTAATIVAEAPEAGSIRRGKVSSLVGVAPHPRQSGTRDASRHISGGRKGVRSALYMATLVATRHNPVIAAHYDALLARGKERKVALVACMRRLLGIINAMLKLDLEWHQLDIVQKFPKPEIAA